MRIICLLGKSGSGKSTVEAGLEKLGYHRIISYTTRPIRGNEQNGINYYYVDKTSYLKAVFTNPAPVMLFTRPRRFGKTLLMDMFATFLTIAEDGSTGRERKEKLFAGLEILDDKDFTDKYMGQFPVISISLKGVFGETFKDAYGKLVEVIADLGEQFSFLGDSEKISKEPKEELALLRNKFGSVQRIIQTG